MPLAVCWLLIVAIIFITQETNTPASTLWTMQEWSQCIRVKQLPEIRQMGADNAVKLLVYSQQI